MKAKKTAKHRTQLRNRNKTLRTFQEESNAATNEAIKEKESDSAQEGVTNPDWVSISHVSTPGLYVQQNTPNGKCTYEVVRIIFVLRGDSSAIKVTTPDGNEEHNPLIVCHSIYQRIAE
jgi:hypothetical protein